MSDVIVHHGDCLAILPTLEAGSVDAIVTDPPYGTGNWQRSESGAGRDPKAILNVEDWDVWEPSWIDEALRVSRGPVTFFVPNGRIFDALVFARETGLPWRLLLWCKPDPRPRFAGQPAFGFEPIVSLRSSAEGGMDYFVASSPRQNRGREPRVHPHQKPLSVMRWLCELVAPLGSTILDPFAGSGTTGVACLRTGRRALLIERDEEYIPIIQKRLKEAETPLFSGLKSEETPLFQGL